MRLGRWCFNPGRWSLSLLVVMLVLLCMLGRWQWGRSVEKQALTQSFAEGAADKPLLIDENSTPQDLQFRRALVSGSLLTDTQYLLDNRTHNGVAGYHVLTPMSLGSGDTLILINRGWVPVGPDREQLPDLGMEQTAVTVEGTVSPPPRVVLLGSSGHDQRGWPRVVQSVDWEAMETALGARLLRAQLLLDPAAEAGFDRHWTPYYGISPERHRAYAVQWFGLALALLVLYLAATVRPASRSRSGR